VKPLRDGWLCCSSWDCWWVLNYCSGKISENTETVWRGLSRALKWKKFSWNKAMRGNAQDRAACARDGSLDGRHGIVTAWQTGMYEGLGTIVPRVPHPDWRRDPKFARHPPGRFGLHSWQLQHKTLNWEFRGTPSTLCNYWSSRPAFHAFYGLDFSVSRGMLLSIGVSLTVMRPDQTSWCFSKYHKTRLWRSTPPS